MFRALVTSLTILFFLIPTSIRAQSVSPVLELRTREQIILDPDQEGEIVVVVVGGTNQNSVKLLLDTTGGIEVVDIVPYSSYVWMNKEFSKTRGTIELAKMTGFTREDLVAKVIIKMTGDSDGTIRISPDSFVGKLRMGSSDELSIKYSGLTRVDEEVETGGLKDILTTFTQISNLAGAKLGLPAEIVTVGLGLFILMILMVIWRLLIRGDRIRSRVPKLKNISEEDLDISTRSKLTPIPAVLPEARSPELPRTAVHPK